jgi:sec-independent protein translocase protein TatA
MDYFSIWHWLIVGVVLLLLFGGRGKVSEIMGDVGKGIKAFKKGVTDTAGAAEPCDAQVNTITHEMPADREQHADYDIKD